MIERVRQCRAHVEGLRTILLAPGQIDIVSFLPRLERAATGLRTLEEPVGPEIKRELLELRSELAMLKRLIAHAANFHAGWAKVLGAATSGYTPRGAVAPLAAPATISLEG